MATTESLLEDLSWSAISWTLYQWYPHTRLPEGELEGTRDLGFSLVESALRTESPPALRHRLIEAGFHVLYQVGLGDQVDRWRFLLEHELVRRYPDLELWALMAATKEPDLALAALRRVAELDLSPVGAQMRRNIAIDFQAGRSAFAVEEELWRELGELLDRPFEEP